MSLCSWLYEAIITAYCAASLLKSSSSSWLLEELPALVPQRHIAWCISCCTPSQLRTAILCTSWASSAPPPARSCWPVEGDLWAQAGKDFFTAGMGAGAHNREKKSSLTSTEQNAKLFNMVILVVGFGGHISTIVLWQTYPGCCKDRRTYLQGVFSH